MEGEWSSFNGVCVNEEADFMAQLFPNSNNNVDLTYHNNPNSSSYYTPADSTSPNAPNLYYFSQDQRTYTHVISDHDHHQGSASNASSSLPIDFLACDQMEGHLNDGLNIEITIDDPVAEDKNNDNSSENNPRKRPIISQVTRGRRNVRGKRREKRSLGGDEEAEEEEENDKESSTFEGAATAPNSGGKTRASRGSATDPQSLYARKRRERINERLKILQSLVPNGTKVDISTMLEEAVNYVKFLQLQIKLLSSDDHWMYAPIAYNGMSIGLDHFRINTAK